MPLFELSYILPDRPNLSEPSEIFRVRLNNTGKERLASRLQSLQEAGKLVAFNLNLLPGPALNCRQALQHLEHLEKS